MLGKTLNLVGIMVICSIVVAVAMPSRAPDVRESATQQHADLPAPNILELVQPGGAGAYGRDIVALWPTRLQYALDCSKKFKQFTLTEWDELKLEAVGLSYVDAKALYADRLAQAREAAGFRVIMWVKITALESEVEQPAAQTEEQAAVARLYKE